MPARRARPSCRGRMEDSPPFKTGRRPSQALALLATSEVTRYSAKSMVSGVRVLAEGEPSPPPNCCWPGPRRRHGGEGNQRGPRDLVAVLGVGGERRGCRLADQVHRRAAVAHRRRLAARAVPRRGEAVLEGLRCRSAARAPRRPARIPANRGPVLTGLASVSTSAIRSDRFAHQNIPGHLSFSPIASGVTPASWSLPHGVQEVRPRRRRLCDPGLLEQRLAVPDADHAEVERHSVLLAVDLVQAGGGRVELVDPARGGLADVLDKARLPAAPSTCRRPRTGTCRVACRPAWSWSAWT